MTTAQIINYIGLTFDIIGIIVLFKYGLPQEINKHGHGYLIVEQEDEEEKIKWEKYYFRSKLGLTSLIIGFILQIISTMWSTISPFIFCP